MWLAYVWKFRLPQKRREISEWVRRFLPCTSHENCKQVVHDKEPLLLVVFYVQGTRKNKNTHS
jgi:hypothetical protein